MNVGQCNPSISILGLQHFPTWHRPNKSKKSIKSGYGVWSHPLSQPWRAVSLQLLTDRHRTCSLVFARSNASVVIVGRHGEVCNNKTTDKVVNQEDRWCLQDTPSWTMIDKGRCSHTPCSGLCTHETSVHKMWARCHCIYVSAGTCWMPLLHYACLLPCETWRFFAESVHSFCVPITVRTFHCRVTETNIKLDSQERGIGFMRVKGPAYFNFGHQDCDGLFSGDIKVASNSGLSFHPLCYSQVSQSFISLALIPLHVNHYQPL